MKNKTALIIGCGGLGCCVIDGLARYGVGQLVLMDGDVFCESNLNRQIYCDYSNLGINKAEIAAKRVKEISQANVKIYREFFDENTAYLIDEADIVLDCVDNVHTRLLLAAECRKRNKILVSGGVETDDGHVLLCTPQKNSMENLYKNACDHTHKTNCYTVGTVANLQVALAIKVLKNDYKNLNDRIILVDLDGLNLKKLELI